MSETIFFHKIWPPNVFSNLFWVTRLKCLRVGWIGTPGLLRTWYWAHIIKARVITYPPLQLKWNIAKLSYISYRGRSWSWVSSSPLSNYCVPLAINLCCLKCLLLRLKNCHCTLHPDNTIKSLFGFFFNMVKPIKSFRGEHKTTLGTGTVLLPSFSILIGRSSFGFSLFRYGNVEIQRV